MHNTIPFPLVKKLLRDLNGKKMLVLALTLVLAVAVCCLSGLGSVFQDLTQGKDHYYQQTRLADFTITLKKAPRHTLAVLAHVPNVKQLQPRIQYAMMVTLPAKTPLDHRSIFPGVAISFVKQTAQTLSQIRLATGKWFSANNAKEGIVVEQFAKAHHLVPGDHLDVLLGGKQYNILIVGVAYSPEYVYILPPGDSLAPNPAGYGVVFMPEGFLSAHLGLQSGYNQLLATVYHRDPSSTANTLNAVAHHLKQYSVLAKTPQSKQSSVQTLDDELSELLTLTSFFPVIFLIVAALVVNVLLTRIVSQQRVIIGTLKALGVGNLRLCMHYISFGLVVGVLGGLVGNVFGVMLQYAMFKLYQGIFIMPGLVFHLHYNILGIGLGVSVLATLLGSISGAIKAMRLAPAEAMRPESPTKGGRILLERITPVWRRLHFRGKLVARSIFRNKFRTLVTLLSTLVATSLLLSTVSLTDSMQKLITNHFSVLSHQQYTLSLREPLGGSIVSTLRALPGVEQMEPALVLPATLWYGPYEKITLVRGMPANNKLYTPYNEQGNIVHIHHDGIVISHSLATLLHVNKGDHIKLRLKIGRRAVQTVKVTDIITSNLGLAAYMNEHVLSTFAGNSWLANQFLFNLDPTLASTFSARVHAWPTVVNLQDKQSLQRILKQLLSGTLTSMIIIISIFAGAIAISCILNNAMVSLNEREREVATFAVLGMTRVEIYKLFLYEGVLVNMIGLALGLWLGVYIAEGFVASLGTEMYRFPFVLKPIRFVEAGALIVGFIVLSYYMVYRAIAKTNWLAVLNIRE